jgi:hypothetical protein
MRLKIENCDAHRTAVVMTVDNGAYQGPAIEIPPGEAKEFWIHNGRQLQIDEKQEGS